MSADQRADGGNTPAKRERGLFGKYRVERVDGKSIDRCIVLELHDPNAWPALLQWAETVEADGYVQLAADVRRWVLTEQDIARVDAMIVGGDGVGMAHPGRNGAPDGLA